MRNDWQEASPRLTSTEADKLVDLWLRRRIAAEEPDAREGVMTVSDVSEALGAKHEEVLALLAEIRTKKKPGKLRPAISVGRSWPRILAIYFLVGAGTLFIIGINRRPYHGPQMVGPRPWENAWVSPSSISGAIPRGIGFNYRGYGSPRIPLAPDEQIDWARGEKTIEEQIAKINSGTATTYEPLVSPQQIDDALAHHTNDPDGSIGSYTGQVGEDLVEWSPLSINVNGNEMRTDVPCPRVSNESVEKAVKLEVKKQIEGMFKAIRTRLSPSDLPEPTDNL